MVAQQKVDHKSNEISAVPKLLKLLNLKRTVVTLDAMGTQIEVAQAFQAGVRETMFWHSKVIKVS
ncbi:MAG: transposase [Moorea sp. SIO2I5]|nr:transposase [Moorena sp. SIO2I5]